MAKAVNMPQIGQDIEKGKIVQWYVKEGDEVAQGDIIASVESEKANFEVEAFESGTLIKIIYREGEEAEVFKPIAFIGEKGEVLQEHEMVAEKVQTEQHAQVADPLTIKDQKKKPDRLFASPTARRMAREHNLNLNEIAGTGPNGRVVKRDILTLIDGSAKQTVTENNTDKVMPFSQMRKRIAERLSYSKQNIPHFYLYREVNVTNALIARNGYNENSDTHLSINDLILFATARVLRDFPNLNSHVENDKLVLKKNINIGLAVSVEDGLLVPVIRDADLKTIGKLSKLAREVIDKAHKGIISGTMPGTFTVSNLGMHGITCFQAIINPPESAILTAGAISKKVVPVDNGFGFADFITLGLACDHRVIDGVYGAKFLESLSHELENIKIE